MPLLEGATPISLAGGDTGILLIHGISSTPQSMRPWAEYLHEFGYTVSVPRLPGHGTSWQECNRTTWQDWYAEVSREFDLLRERCDRVFVFGLSMGATLTLKLAEDRSADLAGIALVNPSVFTKRADRHLMPVLRRVVPVWPGIASDIKKPGVHEVAYSVLPVKATGSLFDLWAEVRPNLGRVHTPVLIVTSQDDHVVEPENSGYILERINSVDRHQEILHNSYHVATLDNDAETLFSGSRKFVERLSA